MSSLLLASTVFAQETEKPKLLGPNILVDVQIVSMPRAASLPVIEKFRDSKTTTEAAKDVQAMIQKDAAKLIAWPVILTTDRERAVFEAIEEFRYATEYGQPEIDIFTDAKVDPSTIAPKLAQPPSAKIEAVAYPAMPTAFEVRNVGVTLEVEPTLEADGKTIDLSLVPQHVRFLGMKEVVVKKENPSSSVTMEQPQFSTSKITTSLRIASGDYTLLGVYPIPEQPDVFELFILHAAVQ